MVSEIDINRRLISIAIDCYRLSVYRLTYAWAFIVTQLSIGTEIGMHTYCFCGYNSTSYYASHFFYLEIYCLLSSFLLEVHLQLTFFNSYACIVLTKMEIKINNLNEFAHLMTDKVPASKTSHR